MSSCIRGICQLCLFLVSELHDVEERASHERGDASPLNHSATSLVPSR